MSSSLFYCADRAEALTSDETVTVERIVAAHTASLPHPDEESLFLYSESGRRPGEIVAGSTKVPLDPDRVLPVVTHVLASLTELRRALPEAEWRVHVEDFDIPWDEGEGYVLPAYVVDLQAEFDGT